MSNYIIGKGQNKLFTSCTVLTDDHTFGGFVVVVHDFEEGVTYPLCHVGSHAQAVEAAQDYALDTDPQTTLENALEALLEAARKYVDSNAFVNKREVEKMAWAINHVHHEMRVGNVKNPNQHS